MDRKGKRPQEKEVDKGRRTLDLRKKNVFIQQNFVTRNKTPKSVPDVGLR